jgi:hypothetical protein
MARQWQRDGQARQSLFLVPGSSMGRIRNIVPELNADKCHGKGDRGTVPDHGIGTLCDRTPVILGLSSAQPLDAHIPNFLFIANRVHLRIFPAIAAGFLAIQHSHQCNPGGMPWS